MKKIILLKILSTIHTRFSEFDRALSYENARLQIATEKFGPESKEALNSTYLCTKFLLNLKCEEAIEYFERYKNNELANENYLRAIN